jgi:hypothetical protein
VFSDIGVRATPLVSWAKNEQYGQAVCLQQNEGWGGSKAAFQLPAPPFWCGGGCAGRGVFVGSIPSRPIVRVVALIIGKAPAVRQTLAGGSHGVGCLWSRARRIEKAFGVKRYTLMRWGGV